MSPRHGDLQPIRKPMGPALNRGGARSRGMSRHKFQMPVNDRDQPDWDDSRDSRSHVNADGGIKQSFNTRADAEAWANQLYILNGMFFLVYVCSQNPLHYHLSREKRRRKESRRGQ